MKAFYKNENVFSVPYIWDSLFLDYQINKSIYKGLNIHLGFNLIDWENANFDPYEISQNNFPKLLLVHKKVTFG